MNITRYPKNPILLPLNKNPWESYAAFNGSVIKTNDKYRMLYRAMSSKQFVSGAELELSVIATAESADGIDFDNRKLLITPSEDWDTFGCEDPRVTMLDNEYFIFYTALSTFPFSAPGIKVGLAISDDLSTVKEKHLITPFNAKAMTLFPEKINGKYAVLFTANTDLPPSKIAVAYFDKKEDLWSEKFWNKWYKSLDEQTLPLTWSSLDQVEVGATPIKTEYGWLLIYCYIENYFTDQRQVQIKGVLLDLKDPKKIVGEIKKPLLVPETDYEIKGNVPNTIFANGAIIEKESLSIYYSACDTSVCLAEVPVKELFSSMQINNVAPVKFEKFKENPILKAIPEHSWESKAVFNPAAISLEGKIYIIYRAQSGDDISRFGLAVSTDGVSIEERLPDPIYSPREDFESRGCEDPRITQIGDKLYICYTAYAGGDLTRVALTSISVENFLKRNWDWEKPILITAPGIYDKDACIFPETFGGKYLFLHRITPGISVDYSKTLTFGESNWLRTQSYIIPKPHSWDDEKIGIGPTPVKTTYGWLLIYHGISKKDHFYRAGAMLMDLKEPQIIIARTEYPILEPTEDYEKIDGRGIVFPCGMVELEKYLYTYYGGGDGNICVAKINTQELLTYLKDQVNKKYLVTPPLVPHR
jgi:predicted GH43/DUF377 family glycosyl hydrolase